MKIVTIIGARPQIIKAAGLSRAIRDYFQNRLEEVIVHTGQHYDQSMSQVFFDELGIPSPDINLNVGSGQHGEQTAKMIAGIEQILLDQQPNAVVLYGDTNSTLAGAIAASKIQVPIVHIEAGLRSFNKKMPEEINRIMCDHVSTLLFTPTKTGLQNLEKEGFDISSSAPFHVDNPGVFHCGDIMYDNSLHFAKLSEKKSNILNELELESADYILATIHRDENTNDLENLTELLESLLEIITKYGMPLVLPLHPRTEKQMKLLPEELLNKMRKEKKMKLIPPVSFLDMIALEKNSQLIMTDSGGVQKEAFFYNKPCVILRNETEWTELVDCGAAQLAGRKKEQILFAFEELIQTNKRDYPALFGDGQAGKFMCEKVLELLA